MPHPIRADDRRTEPSAAASGIWAAWQRRSAVAALAERALSESFGARAAIWLARSFTLGYGIALLLAARPAPGSVHPLLHLALASLSLCAGLAALSAAGDGLRARLDRASGLLRSRGLVAGDALGLRAVAVACWVPRRLTPLALLLAGIWLVFGRPPDSGMRALTMGAGLALYLALLALALGCLVQLAAMLGGERRGRLALLLLVGLPELLAPAWPELPTVLGALGALLDRCLDPGFGG